MVSALSSPAYELSPPSASVEDEAPSTLPTSRSSLLEQAAAAKRASPHRLVMANRYWCMQSLLTSGRGSSRADCVRVQVSRRGSAVFSSGRRFGGLHRPGARQTVGIGKSLRLGSDP